MQMSGRSRPFWKPVLTLCALFFVLVGGLILGGSENGSEAYDQNHHHLVVIRQASEVIAGSSEAPTMADLLRDYPSATSPGYHLLLATVRAAGVKDVTLLRAVSSLFGLALALTLWWGLQQRVDGWTALALTVPLLVSPYFLSGSIWLTTDVAAAFCVTVAIVLMLRGAETVARMLILGLAMTAAVAVRQPSIWLLGPLCIVAAIDSRPGWPRSQWLAWSLALVAPAMVLAGLVALWGGLVPPDFQAQHNRGANLATPGIFLALCGVVAAPWFLATLVRRAATSRESQRWASIGAMVGLGIAVAFASNFERDSGRWGGPIWEVIRALPAPMGRSIVVLVGAPLGGAALALLLVRVFESGARREGLLLSGVILSLLAALSANSQCFERYVDLPLLVIIPLALVAATGAISQPAVSSLRRGAVVVAAIQLALSTVMVYAPALQPVATSP